MPSQSKKSLFYRIMAKFTAAIDPKLEKYRPPKKKEPPFTPKTEDELIGVIKRTPKTLLDAQARNLLASAMAFDKMAVSVIMSPKRDMEFLHETDYVFFVRTDYTLEMLLATFLRTNSSYCIVINRDEKIEGYVTLDTLMYVLFGREIADSFDNDSNATAVAKRSKK